MAAEDSRLLGMTTGLIRVKPDEQWRCPRCGTLELATMPAAGDFFRCLICDHVGEFAAFLATEGADDA
jgi:hypothetical protein